MISKSYQEFGCLTARYRPVRLERTSKLAGLVS